jgi:hypothetical protein
MYALFLKSSNLKKSKYFNNSNNLIPKDSMTVLEAAMVASTFTTVTMQVYLMLSMP